MSNRPRIPAEIEREILLECGYRCAVDGTPLPLERAHIIPWHESREHKVEDLICLCANCHERADREKWGEKLLREFKQKPWVMRQGVDKTPAPSTKVEVTIDIELEHFDEKNQRWLQYAIAAFLDILPHAVRITSVEKGNSVKVTIELPTQNADRLLIAYERNDSELVRYLAPLILLDLRREAAGRERVLKKIEAIIWPHLLRSVKDALQALGVQGMTVSEVKDFDSQKGRTEFFRGREFRVEFESKVKIEVVLDEEIVENAIDAIIKTAPTGKFSDRKIFVFPVENAIRIRTDEHSERAV